MNTVIALALMFFSLTVAASDVRAVVNPDGSVSYFSVKSGETNQTKNIENDVIKEYLSNNPKDLRAFELKASDNTTAGFIVAGKNPDSTEPVSYAVDNGLKAVATNYENLPRFSKAYTLASDKGKVSTLWLANDSPESTVALDKVIPPKWSASKVSSANNIGSKIVEVLPIPKEKFLKDLGESMLEQAKTLACKSKVRPKDISVTASLAASIGLVVGGEGTISFAATWETSSLCN